MAVKSLNEAYKADPKTLFYLCDSFGNITFGDINDPNNDGVDVGSCEPEDVLTAEELNLYNNYWAEGRWTYEYVMRIDGRPYIGLGFLVDDDWVKKIAGKALSDVGKNDLDEGSKNWMATMLKAAKTVAEIFIQPTFQFCDVYVGDMTDGMGHEILVVVPYEERERLDEVGNTLHDSLYDELEKEFRKLVFSMLASSQG